MPYAFNARLDSIAKRYRYCIYQGPQRSALHQPYFWWIKNKLNVEAMQRAAQFLVGEHDFESFRSAHCDAEHATRYIHSINVTERHYAKASKEIFIDVYGNAFCRHMVRILSGTLAEVGKGLREAENIQEILRVKDRTRAGVTAPSCGLTLLEVEYPQDIWI